MKIKEVIRITELTDKAIRLYINSGLVAPSIDESYSGRKSIEFSADDVERLNNIALLRKAGFSIADIKEIIESDEKARAVVERFIDETESNIQHKTEIIEKLKSIPAENGISMETICESLSKTVEKKKVPKEDLWLTTVEKILNKIFAVLGNIGIATSLGCMVIICIEIHKMYEHPHLDLNVFSLPVFALYLTVFFGGWIAVLILSAFILHMNQYQYSPNGKNIIKSLPTTVVTIIMIIVSVNMTVFGIWFLPLESYTVNPDNYLEFDSFFEAEFDNKIRNIFPPRIPNTAKTDDKKNYLETTKYYYRYNCSVDPNLNIVAEWTLSPYEYDISKNKAFKTEHTSVQKGNWTCLYYENGYTVEEKNKNNWQDKFYRFLIFAYNDKENKVRYIASYVVDDSGDGPYYLTLDW